MEYTVFYKVKFIRNIEADTPEQAKEIAESYSMEDLKDDMRFIDPEIDLIQEYATGKEIFTKTEQ